MSKEREFYESTGISRMEALLASVEDFDLYADEWRYDAAACISTLPFTLNGRLNGRWYRFSAFPKASLRLTAGLL